MVTPAFRARFSSEAEWSGVTVHYGERGWEHGVGRSGAVTLPSAAMRSSVGSGRDVHGRKQHDGVRPEGGNSGAQPWRRMPPPYWEGVNLCSRSPESGVLSPSAALIGCARARQAAQPRRAATHAHRHRQPSYRHDRVHGDNGRRSTGSDGAGERAGAPSPGGRHAAGGRLGMSPRIRDGRGRLMVRSHALDLAMAGITGGFALNATAFDLWCGRAAHQRAPAFIALILPLGYALGFSSYPF